MNKKDLENLGFNETLIKLIEESKSDFTAEINKTKVISNLFLAETVRKSTDRIIKSNKCHSIMMGILTLALVAVGSLQVYTSNKQNNIIEKQITLSSPVNPKQ